MSTHTSEEQKNRFIDEFVENLRFTLKQCESFELTATNEHETRDPLGGDYKIVVEIKGAHQAWLNRNR